MGVSDTTRLPAGWYPDPDGTPRRRWWDGREWTEYTAAFQKPAPIDLPPETAASPVPVPVRRATAPSHHKPEPGVVQRGASALGRLVAGVAHQAGQRVQRARGSGRRRAGTDATDAPPIP